MAAEVLGGTSAAELGPAQAPAEALVAQPPSLDLNFVGEVVQGESWSAWGERFSSLDDLLDRIRRKLAPGQRIRRLALASYSAEHTSGYMAFDTGITSRERIDGLNQTPIKAEVAAKLAQLRPLMADDGVLELRVAGIGHGDHGLKALQAVADTVGAPARGPLEKAFSMAPSLGLITDWLTVYPADRGQAPVHSGWRERSPDGARPIEAAFAPLPGDQAPSALPRTAVELAFVTENALTWAPSAHRVGGIAELVDSAIRLAEGRPISRLAIISMGSSLYDGYVAFDRAEGESVDGNIREEPAYPHLRIMYQRVQVELQRLAPHLAPAAEIEFRVARLGVGDAGRRALQKIADATGASVRAPLGSIGELKAGAGLITRWITVRPSALALPPVESVWREVSEPAPNGPWIPIEAAAFAPIRGVDPPLPRAAAPAKGVAAETTPLPETAPGGTVLVVRCAECGRVMDELPGTTLPGRQPCPACGSIARRRGLESQPGRAPSARGGVRARLGQVLGRTRQG